MAVPAQGSLWSRGEIQGPHEARATRRCPLEAPEEPALLMPSPELAETLTVRIYIPPSTTGFQVTGDVSPAWDT